MEQSIERILTQLTLEEKASLCSGQDFWRLKEISRLGIPSIRMADGPHGLRKEAENADYLAAGQSLPATCFPSAAGLACTWNRTLIRQMGEALGKECQAEGVSVLLGPGANIKRSPLCGRNFEYFSEDPYLSSEMAASHIEGVQSQGVGTSLKHFALNNQEYRKMTVDAVADERTLREIYLASFEGAVKKARPWTVMTAYNRVNGEYCAENKRLLTDILREEWGYEGAVISDWGAVNERVDGLLAGLDLEMPFNLGEGDAKIVQAVQSGELPEEQLDRAVKVLLELAFKGHAAKREQASFDPGGHHDLARKVAAESMVLLRNEQGILPLSKEASIAVIGGFARRPRFQGGGSSHIVPTRLDIAYEEIGRKVKDPAQITYAQGYRPDDDEIDAALLAEAAEAAAKAEVAVIFAGLPDRYETEGYDRSHLRLPGNHLRLIEEVAKVQSNLVVVLSNGSPVEMPWIGQTRAVLEAYLGGQAAGGAVADLLFGDANPSGKLAETFPAALEHNPSYLFFPGEKDRAEYKEGVFVGYRYYDAKALEPLFPFGHGLSYTRFEYSGLTLSSSRIREHETLTVSVRIKNAGEVAGKEIVQLYVSDREASVARPPKELKGFEKLELQPGEEKTVIFELNKRAFAYYDVELGGWHVESGFFDILIGRSSRDIAAAEAVYVESAVKLKPSFTRNSTLGDLLAKAAPDPLTLALIEQFKLNSGIFPEDKPADIAAADLHFLPLRALVSLSKGGLREEDMEVLLTRVNKS
ncbi:glycoside hydrolase family 3 C-terminal domain-containing protein [Paenibacillus macerans]|uniref:Thermostable beta-glucosidase B n=1 Tax=Paenibacillus macerans TaxID=44252 RepID=A0A090ZEX2_PAEMA|nr:glycoside hydrolase family 3 C-terminal domain-containing protein [Paenibacillus macerans]KFN09869.1 thermostable beta-glucosidase B [Paenibacillus macerans]MCY7558691.1 glycoside hydrolase family 3 C-terminal domain-containing protein [Paenibacillus macerans]MEC0154243.1 glycoside hydrolase family 3 C-terminal domain-containing protein [Paenibacillus macerans]SUA82143.1 protein BglB [Paenibacillus macerans]